MTRRLYRSVADRRIGGVAAGTATYFDIDPSIARVLWLVLAFFTGGVFLIIYLVMWAVVPEEPFAPGSAPGSAPAGTEAETVAAGKRGSKAPTGGETGPVSSATGMPPSTRAGEGPGGRVILGAILILIGGWFLAREFLPWLDFDFVWPVALVVAGILILAAALRRPA